MCGIAGIADSQALIDEGLIRQMCTVITHRGPDSDGYVDDGCVRLGVRRLRIIDLNTGDQPIYNEDRSIVVVYNGEIYNYRELRTALEQKGHCFYTETDTETLVHLYEEYGVTFPEKLNGIFAFALWDSREQRLVIGRDYYGIKPLYYAQQGSRLLFGSEIKCILQDANFKRELNHQSLHVFLNLRYIPGEETLFQQVKRLRPGHVLVWQGGRVNCRRYWTDNTVPQPVQRSQADTIEGLRHYLSEAVRKQLMSDVPLGVYLSGGIDSSTVAAYASQHLDQPVKTFALGFNEPTDELNDARFMAQHIGSDHHELAIDLDPLKHFPRVIWHAEEPKENILQGFLLAEFARRHVTVALSGLGGDELFAGYAINRYIAAADKLHPLVPDWAIGIGKRLSSLLFQAQNFPVVRRFDILRRAAQMVLSTGDPAQYYLILRNVWDADAGQYANVYADAMSSTMQTVAPTRSYFDPYFTHKSDALTQALYAEFHTKMVDDFLMNEDRMSMGNSLEVRVPLLDRDLVQFAWTIPTDLKLHNGTMKYIFKEAMRGILPDAILNKKKWGFTFNSYYQFKKDLRDVAQRILTPQRVAERGLFNYAYLKEIMDAPPNSHMKWHYFFLWNVVGLEIWCQMFLDNAPTQPDFDLQAYG